MLDACLNLNFEDVFKRMRDFVAREFDLIIFKEVYSQKISNGVILKLNLIRDTIWYFGAFTDFHPLLLITIAQLNPKILTHGNYQNLYYNQIISKYQQNPILLIHYICWLGIREMVNIFYLDEDPAKCVQYYHDKQVSIMGTQVAQILHKIHSHCDHTHVNPFKNQNAVKIGLNVCQWILESKENYKYCAAVGYYLIQEYKYRFDKDSHPHEEKIKWLYENIPQKIPDHPQTPFKLSKNVYSYHIAYKDTLDACKISYIDYKLKPNIKWSKRGKPAWLDESLQKSKQIKTEQLNKLSKMKIEDGHYDKLLGKNWKSNKFMYGKMFELKGEMLGQLGSGHLYHLRCIVEGDGNLGVQG